MSKILNPYCSLWTSKKINLNIDNTYTYLPVKYSLLLMSDGSFTKVLDSLINQTTQIILAYNQVKHINNQNNYYDTRGLKIHRQGWLIDKMNNKLLFANSWYKSEVMKNYRCKVDMPLGKVFINSELTFYRKLYSISCFCSKWFEQQFHAKGYIWSREYILFHKKIPFVFIQEFFSPKLIEYLEPRI